MDVLEANAAAEWRTWLASTDRAEIWLVIQRKDSGTPGMSYGEAIEHALCYGWIDSHARKRDADSWQLRFTPRTSRSRWSEVNRRRATNMIERGLMTQRGQAVIDLAKAKGTWPGDQPKATCVSQRSSSAASPRTSTAALRR